jgi:hypothetical protein
METPPDAISERDLKAYWSEIFYYNVKRLRLDSAHARSWATRRVLLKLESMQAGLQKELQH